MTSAFSRQNSLALLACFVLYSKAKFDCYSRYLLTSYFCVPVPYNEKDIFFGCQFQRSCRSSQNHSTSASSAFSIILSLQDSQVVNSSSFELNTSFYLSHLPPLPDFSLKTLNFFVKQFDILKLMSLEVIWDDY